MVMAAMPAWPCSNMLHAAGAQWEELPNSPGVRDCTRQRADSTHRYGGVRDRRVAVQRSARVRLEPGDEPSEIAEPGVRRLAAEERHHDRAAFDLGLDQQAVSGAAGVAGLAA